MHGPLNVRLTFMFRGSYGRVVSPCHKLSICARGQNSFHCTSLYLFYLTLPHLPRFISLLLSLPNFTPLYLILPHFTPLYLILPLFTSLHLTFDTLKNEAEEKLNGN